jgi:hypothetical protein
MSLEAARFFQYCAAPLAAVVALKRTWPPPIVPSSTVSQCGDSLPEFGALDGSGCCVVERGGPASLEAFFELGEDGDSGRVVITLNMGTRPW